MEDTSAESSEPLLRNRTQPTELSSPWHESRKNTHVSIIQTVISALILLLLSYIAAFLTITFITESRHDASTLFPKSPYSPATKALKYEKRPLWDNTDSPYDQPPSPATDLAWDDLLSSQFIRASPAELAAQHENLTHRVQLPNGDYMGSLGVWHQLHCLDILRKAVHMDYYRHHLTNISHADVVFAVEHYDHCIGTLRRAVMCHADVGLYSFEWAKDSREARNKVLKSDAKTVCVNWEALSRWAGERALKKGKFKLLARPFEKSHEQAA
ncbi:uncharacterized protein BDZ99DRAFT_169394 [Mytilinidion resinicola]|uniref:Tat pathway signal sequence n=1 Tax=Mytilinidion resinicola TaxID=574789 RepID=A0A6A6Y3Z1_9PEZI|nr:uncharacterized protein BDZ99DRAFT_169394 [Mytilinidion resinicola]KAF2803238.1 hypothetical protein BDZ99DRAFT_169394 [Mytilinidion resinicola]